jgi:hypothetical protein
VAAQLSHGRLRVFDTCFNFFEVKKVLKTFLHLRRQREANFAASTSTNRRRRVSANSKFQHHGTKRKHRRNC